MLTTRKKIITPLEWADTLTVGVPEIDEDHKMRLSLFNRCIKVANGARQNNEQEVIPDELIAYTQYHVQREERIMGACDYPLLQKHRKVHHLLLREVQQYKRQYDRGDLTIYSRLDFLSGWLIVHITDLYKAVTFHCKGKKKLIQQALKE